MKRSSSPRGPHGSACENDRLATGLLGQTGHSEEQDALSLVRSRALRHVNRARELLERYQRIRGRIIFRERPLRGRNFRSGSIASFQTCSRHLRSIPIPDVLWRHNEPPLLANKGWGSACTFGRLDREDTMRKRTGEKKTPCKNCEGKGTLKKGDKIVRCQRCGGTGIKPS